MVIFNSYVKLPEGNCSMYPADLRYGRLHGAWKLDARYLLGNWAVQGSLLLGVESSEAKASNRHSHKEEPIRKYDQIIGSNGTLGI